MLARQLRIARFMLKSQRVVDAAETRSLLGKSKWDAVVCDYQLRNFSARQALDLIKGMNLDIPLIVFTREIDDEHLTEIMRAGARDVVHKSRPGRIIPAIEREIQAAEERREHRRTLRTIREMEEKHRAMVQGTREAVCYCTDGMHTEANQAYLSLFGYDSLEELEGIPVLNLIDKSGHKPLKEQLRRIGKGKSVDESLELTGLKKDGSKFDIELALARVEIQGEPCTQITVRDVSQRKVAENRLQFLSQRDPLTGLYNRHHFTKLLGEAIQSAKSRKRSGVLLYLNLYRLREINSALGYTAGDRMLIKITKLLREHLGEDSLAARLGSEEFAILLPEADEAEGQKVVKTIKGALKEAALSEKGKTFECSCATSLTLVNAGGNAQELLTRAFNACERPQLEVVASAPPAAAQGGGAETAPPLELAPDTKPLSGESEAAAPASPAAPPEAAPAAPANELSPMQKKVQKALESNGFRLAYQPIINLHGDPEEYFEVLLRMVGDDGSLIMPGEFMPEAEAAGQIRALDKWVIEHAIEALSALHSEGRLATFFINLSPGACEHEELIPFIQKCIQDSQLEPRFVTLEIDEDTLNARPEAGANFVRELSEYGCLVSIDNFNMNPDTLLNLPRKSVKFVKMDGGLVARSENGEGREQLTEIMGMAKKLDIKSVAKSIEDAASLSALWTFGFDYVQGNYFQQADAELAYDFVGEDEAELSSDNMSFR